MENEERPLADIQVDAENLYREETFTDLRIATLRRLTPIRSDGSEDSSRSVRFIGETQLMSARGLLPVSAPIDAPTIDEAIAQFPEAINQAVERLIEEARELQRQEASRIVVPGQGPMGPMGPGGPGGKIQLD
ncbi:MAG: hypothetical protein VX574_08040 [Myxococcota bacterium]|nr:hypothetical protein [Myxococcota bacterium]